MAPTPRRQPVSLGVVERARASSRPRPQHEQPTATEPVAQRLLLMAEVVGQERPGTGDQVVPGQPGDPELVQVERSGRRLREGVGPAGRQHHVEAPVVGGQRRRNALEPRSQLRPGPADRSGARPPTCTNWCSALGERAGRSRRAACGRRRPRGTAPAAPGRHGVSIGTDDARSRRRGRSDASGSARPCGSSGRGGRSRTAPGRPGRVGGCPTPTGKAHQCASLGSASAIRRKRVPAERSLGTHPPAGPLVPADAQAAPDPVVGRDAGDAGPDQVDRRLGRRGAAATPATRRSPGRRAGSRRGSCA